MARKKEERKPEQGHAKETLDTTLAVEWWPTERPLPYEHNPRMSMVTVEA